MIGAPMGCASPSPTPVEVPELSPASKAVHRMPVGSVERREVEQTVEAGLGAFLQRLSVEPVIEGDKFVGFRLVDIDPAMIRQGIDIQVGDVLTKANGHSLEVETEAFAAFEGLRTAKEIRLALRRNGRQQEVVIPIIGDPTSGPTTSGADAGAPVPNAG